jgi:hypothetical protein
MVCHQKGPLRSSRATTPRAGARRSGHWTWRRSWTRWIPWGGLPGWPGCVELEMFYQVEVLITGVDYRGWLQGYQVVELCGTWCFGMFWDILNQTKSKISSNMLTWNGLKHRPNYNPDRKNAIGGEGVPKIFNSVTFGGNWISTNPFAGANGCYTSIRLDDVPIFFHDSAILLEISRDFPIGITILFCWGISYISHDFLWISHWNGSFLAISQDFPGDSHWTPGTWPFYRRFPRPVLLSLSTSRGQLQRRFHSAAAAAQWLRSSCGDMQRLDEELGSSIAMVN